MSRVAIVGPGRVGTLLAVACARAGHRVVAVAGGSAHARDRVAGLVAGLRPVEGAEVAARDADLVLLAVPDDALAEVATGLAVADAVGPDHRVVHVAGAHGLAPLARVAATGARVAACHPAMTVPVGAHDPALLVGAAWAVTAGPADRAWSHALVEGLGGDAHDVPDDRRSLYHAGCAVASNAVGAAVVIARQLLLAARVGDPAAFLGPLVGASVGNASAAGAAALTGPVVRGDTATLAAHRAAIEADLPALLDGYLAAMRTVVAAAATGRDDDVTAAVLAALDGTDA